MSASEDCDLENHHSSSLEDVCDRLDNIETAVTGNHWDTSWIWALVAYFAISVWVPDIWHRKARYAFEYGVGADQIIKQNKPHDCDWFAAPLGSKFCHYDIKVGEISRQNAETGRTEFSYDEGKTWAYGSMNYPRPLVYVGWNKVDD
jgi:hypothetical protein